MTPTDALAFWLRALSEELGLILTLAPDVSKKAVEKALYEARKGREDLQALSLVFPGDAEREVWIIKRPTNMEDVT